MHALGPHRDCCIGSLYFREVLGGSAQLIVRSPGRQTVAASSRCASPSLAFDLFPLWVLSLGNWPLF